MKRLAIATVALTALATAAQAGGLPKPISLVERMKNFDLSHFPRGAEVGRGSGGSTSTEAEPEAEARKEVKGQKTAKAKKEKPQAAKTAD